MIDGKEILKELKSRWYGGETQQEIAKATGVSRPYLCGLFSGKNEIEGLSLKKLNQLFPKATLHLYGDTVSITADQNRGNVVGVNHGSLTSSCADRLSAAENKILNSSELTAEEKIKVLKVLKK